MKKSNTKKGSALIIVLLVVAILTTVGVSSIDRLQADISRSTDFSLRLQSHWYALGLESRVSDFIRERQKIRNFSNLLIPDQDIPSILVTIEGGNLEGKLFDLQTCFNLNSVVRLDSQDRRVINQIGVDQYRGLLSELGLDEYSQDQIIYPLVDWLDSDDFVQDINGAEDDFYTRLKSPYRAANQLLYDISELKDIKNYSKNSNNPENQQAIFYEAENGDIVIKATKGNIRFEGDKIDFVARKELFAYFIISAV